MVSTPSESGTWKGKKPNGNKNMEDLIMKKTLLFIAAAVMFVLAGCQKDQYIQESKKNDIIHINVGQIAPATRVAAVDIDAAKLSFKFEEGDEVAFVNGNTMRITEFTCTNPATGEFEKTDGDALDQEGQYIIFYPASAADYLLISDGVYPQNYRANQISKEHLIMASNYVSGASTEFNLDYHFGIIHFQLKGNAEIGSIEYQSRNGESEYDEVSTILSCGEGVQLSDTPTHFYMDVISTSHYGFKLTFKDASGNELGKQESKFNLYANEGKMVDFATPLTVNASPTPSATTGTAKRTGDIDVNWVQLWDGGPRFAEYNVGAENSKAEDYGGYYGWGGTQDKNYNDYNDGSDPLTGDDDTATNLWGSNWRMPTQTELAALLSSCDVVWTTVGGVNGCKFTGKGAYASNSVFLPAAGKCSWGNVDDQGYNGYYWSSTPEGNNFAYYLDFLSGYQNVDDRSRYHGCSVRAVLK